MPLVDPGAYRLGCDHQVAVRQGVDLVRRLPLPAIPGDKRVVEALAKEVYAMELRGESNQHIWAYRKAAWAIEDTPQDLGLICRAMGRKGLGSIENVGPRLSELVEGVIKDSASI